MFHKLFSNERGATLNELPKRRDEEGDFHDQVEDTCAGCGCTIFRAADEPEILWEPGSAWMETCSDRDCHCHTDPVIGARR